jgi:cardiolipin synthase
MSTEAAAPNFTWLRTGQEYFPATLTAIHAAVQSVCLESYIYAPGALGERIRAALIAAAQRGARVRVLYDALGSYELPGNYWDPLRAAGGEVRQFNPLSLNRLGIRDHRKLLVCDDRVAFIGGFNISPEYDGDGVTRGWHDLGLRIEGPLISQLAASFEDMFARADFLHKRFTRLRKSGVEKAPAPRTELLLSGPGRGNPIKRSLQRDLAYARDVQIMVAYLLPTWPIRRRLNRVARRGGRVELILPGRSDVALSQLAGQSLYRRFLKAGLQIYEYQPQILHAKLIIIDDIVYAGSANLDQRSLNINYELLVRLKSRALADQAREIFGQARQHCQPITLETWLESRGLWQRLKQRWAHFLLVRLDPHIARWQWRALPD